MNINYFEYDENAKYPREDLYNPEAVYPEMPFEKCLSSRNDIYRMVRKIFYECGYDRENYGKENWNPLGCFIKQGDTVLIKPNLVLHANYSEKNLQRGLDCLVTHPSVIRVVFDYVYIALNGKGKIIIADAPVQDCDFEELCKNGGYDSLFQFMQSKQTADLYVEIADLRETVLSFDKIQKKQRQFERKKIAYTGKVVDLGSDSYFADSDNIQNLRITNYDARETVKYHSNGRNQYCISEALLEADVVVDLCKPKTHSIAGYTAALKNMIGINARKEYLPHHKKGAEGSGGDEYIATHVILKWCNSTGNDIKNWALKNHKHRITDYMNCICRTLGRKLDTLENERKKYGRWHGNDTIWRTILDINKIVLYSDKEGKMQKNPQRKVIHIGDMIVSGEKEGPLNPSYKFVGGILFSENAISFDCCATKLMGIRWSILPVLLNALNDKTLFDENGDELILRSNCTKYNKKLNEMEDNFNFILSSGWREKQ